MVYDRYASYKACRVRSNKCIVHMHSTSIGYAARRRLSYTCMCIDVYPTHAWLHVSIVHMSIVHKHDVRHVAQAGMRDVYDRDERCVASIVWDVYSVYRMRCIGCILSLSILSIVCMPYHTDLISIRHMSCVLYICMQIQDSYSILTHMHDTYAWYSTWIVCRKKTCIRYHPYVTRHVFYTIDMDDIRQVGMSCRIRSIVHDITHLRRIWYKTRTSHDMPSDMPSALDVSYHTPHVHSMSHITHLDVSYHTPHVH